jgi:hypothetical protein
LYNLTLRRRDLPEWFFVIEEHKRRALAANNKQEHDPHWIVESVTATGSTEPVYCATVDGSGAFGLADDLMTGNCSRMLVGKMAGFSLHGSAGAIGNAYVWSSVVGTALHSFMEEAFTWDSVEGLNPGRWFTERRVTPDPGAEQPHPGTADMYDGLYRAVVDWKCQSEAVRTRLRRDGPPVHYSVQMLLYAVGYMLLGFEVERVVLVSWPRTKSTLEDMYVWEHTITNDDLRLVQDVLDKTEIREQIAKLVTAGEMSFWDVPPTPGADCTWCPFHNPAALQDRSPNGCPGMSLLKLQRSKRSRSSRRASSAASASSLVSCLLVT